MLNEVLPNEPNDGVGGNAEGQFQNQEVKMQIQGFYLVVLNHLIGAQGSRPDPEKIQALPDVGISIPEKKVSFAYQTKFDLATSGPELGKIESGRKG